MSSEQAGAVSGDGLGPIFRLLDFGGLPSVPWEFWEPPPQWSSASGARSSVQGLKEVLLLRIFAAR